jgi:membrane-bound lytic murein transglycosylase B
VERMTGSWAGAMGQMQFMPSSFRRYAVDQDGDGRRDLWGTKADVFASAANYLKHLGWRSNQTWGRQVRLPKGFDHGLIGRDRVRPLDAWRALGVRRADGGALPRADLPTSIVQPGGAGGAAYAVYDNYRALLKWNRSDYFATAAGILSDRISGP